MLVLLAAGLASSAARYLVQANWVPAWGNQIWDSSSLLSNGSVLGNILHILIGYDAQPSGIQLVFYGVVVVLLVLGMKLVGDAGKRAKAAAASTPSAQGAPAG